MTRQRAFSLIEGVFTLFIVFLLLGLCCDLFKQYSATLSFSAAKSTSLTTIQVALQTMLDDARQATSFASPAAIGGSGSPTLEMVVVDPKLLHSPSRGPGDLIQVKYYLSTGAVYPAGALLRDSTPATGTTTTWKVADALSGFNVVGLGTWGTGVNAVEIQLSLQESVRTLKVVGDSSRLPF